MPQTTEIGLMACWLFITGFATQEAIEVANKLQRFLTTVSLAYIA